MPSQLRRVILPAIALLATARAEPLRVLYVDPVGAEREKVGPLHKAMEQHGRDAIFYDYHAGQVDAVTAARYDVVLVSGDAKAAGIARKALPVAADAAPESLRAAVLGAVPAPRRAQWETFLAGREEEKREKNPNVANYEKRPEPITFQHPFSPKGSMERIQVPADLKLELFASEPDIGKPIAFAWDERGRCWVAETADYPHGVKEDGVGSDRIKICEDTNGDGKADKFTVFAEGLNIPTGLVFADGGLIVSQPPRFLFMQDTNGDDKADVRREIMTGWGIGDTHAQASNLHHGYDNWLYGAAGYSGFKGTVGGRDMAFAMGSYRFKSDGSAMEFLHQFTNNTWAHSANEAGDQFGGTANGAPIFFGGFPASLAPQGVRIQTAKKINVVNEAHAITPNYRQVDVMGGYTAAAGSSFIYSDRLPARYQGMAMVCEPTMKLVALMDVVPDGSGYKALDAYNIFASSDEWTSPVYAEVGPDGAVWVADFQNFIIQHNPTPNVGRGGYDAKTGVGGAHENPLRDHSRGRIYRITARDPRPAAPRAEGPLAGLSAPTQYERLFTQRRLVEKQDKSGVTALGRMTRANDGHIRAIHALWTLHGLGALDAETHRAALLAKDARLRRNAIRALGSDSAAAALFFGAGVVSDPDATTRLAALVKLMELPTTPEIQSLVKKLAVDPVIKGDEWLANAVKALGVKHDARAFREGPNLLPNPGFEDVAADGLPAGWKRRDYGKRPGNEKAEWKVVDGGRAGAKAVRCITRDDADTSLHADVTLKPNTEYRLSAWVKAHGLRGKVSLNVHGAGIETDKITRSGDWQLVEATFNSKDRITASVNVLHVAKGDGYWDEVRLSELVPDTGTEETLAKGDALRGKDIFQKHPTAACVLCHMLGGQGSTVGPALDGIGGRKDEAYLRQSLLDPNASLSEGYTATPISPMPPMGLILKPQEIEDVLAFLMSLKP